MTDSEWTDWIEHKCGECPIPDAKAGDYQIRFRDGCKTKSSELTPASTWFWGEDDSKTITHYRLRKPAIDWKARAEAAEVIAAELAEALLPFAKYTTHGFDTWADNAMVISDERDDGNLRFGDFRTAREALAKWEAYSAK
jgi:hypothetical protein